MDRDALMSLQKPREPLVAPFPVLMTGLGAVALGWLLGAVLQGGAPALRAILLTVGVLATGAALALQLPYTEKTREGRLLAAGMWLLAAVVTVVARLALDPSWDSIALLSRWATLACLLAAAVTALPEGKRMIAITLLVLFHFGGICVAVVNVPPANSNPPWLATQLWMRVYRPWLTLTNLNNGYHFYSPEPGPVALVFFRVEYADGLSRWVRIPNHAECENHLTRRRFGSLATTIGQSIPMMPQREEELCKRRIEGGRNHEPPIPPMPDMPLPTQYREPGVGVRLILSSYARWVAKTTPHPLEEKVPVVGVKIYRVDHMHPPVEHFQEGRDPLDPTLYLTWYMGEYEANGTIKESCFKVRRDKQGQVVEVIQDPFLWWQIPILRVPESAERPPEAEGSAAVPASRSGRQTPGPWSGEGKIMNYVYIHAGDKDKAEEALP
jgi:hypothetical protein